MNKKAFTIKELSVVIGLYTVFMLLAMPTIKNVLNFNKNNQNTAINQDNTQVVVNTAAEVVKENESCDKRVPGAGLNYQGDGIYNFVGSNPDNWVNFDGKLWRILRINEDNTLRLIYPESIGTSQFRDSDTMFTGSTVETFLNNWYNNTSNISTTAKTKIVDGKFCNQKMRGPNSKQECETYLTLKVGLMGILDYRNAATYSTPQSTSNITSLSQNWLCIGEIEWTITPDSYPPTVWIISYCLTDYASSTTLANAVRPVINLTSSITITSGTGTKSNPYILN